MESKVKFPLEEANGLAIESLVKLGYNEEQSKTISHHLIDSELRRFGIAGLARILSIADRLKGEKPATTTKITKEAIATTQIDGQDTLGYLVAYEATTLAIEKCKQAGIAVVGANGTYYTGMLSYYAEMAAVEGLVTVNLGQISDPVLSITPEICADTCATRCQVISSHCTPWVAPEGTYKPLLGTNPFCIGIPSASTPIIYDIGTSKIINAQIVLAKRLGRELPEGTAFDAEGNPTTNPSAALAGAMAVWGGAKGSGLSLAVQLLGIVAGAPALPKDLEDFGFLIMVVNPAMFRPMGEFKEEVEKMKEAWHAAPSLTDSPMRLPFERSDKMRAEMRASGYIEVEAGVIERLKSLITS